MTTAQTLLFALMLAVPGVAQQFETRDPLFLDDAMLEVTVEALRDATAEEIEHGHPHGPGGHHH